MMLINERAHEVVDRACENLTRWPNEFINQEDLVMLIHEAIEAAIEEDRAKREPTETQLKHQCQCEECDPQL